MAAMISPAVCDEVSVSSVTNAATLRRDAFLDDKLLFFNLRIQPEYTQQRHLLKLL